MLILGCFWAVVDLLMGIMTMLMMTMIMMMMMLFEESPSKTARLRLSDVVRLFGILQSRSNLLIVI